MASRLLGRWRWARRAWDAWAGFVGLAVLAGCGAAERPQAELPKLYPAQGTVTRSGQPVSGGLVQLRPVSGEAGVGDLIVNAPVGTDGRFELSTIHALSQRKARGAPAGQYTVIYHPPAESQDVQTVPLSTPVTISAGPNQLTLSLDAP